VKSLSSLFSIHVESGYLPELLFSNSVHPYNISIDKITAMENLARYIIRASFPQERMQYLDQEGKVVYTSKDGKSGKVSLAMEWLAGMYSHIPNRGEQMVRYY
jgi:hypothetical protein